MAASEIPKEQSAIQISKHGGVKEIELKTIGVEVPADNQVLVKVEWSGINFIDTYFRTGLYPVKLPFVLGNEPAGTIVALGPNLREKSEWKLGDRVIGGGHGGGLKQYVICDIGKTFKLPKEVSTKVAATVFLSGLTALTIITEAYPAKKEDYVLVHAAAGGLGLLLCQLLANIGVTVIGTTSTAEKAELAKANGAKHVVIYSGRPYEEVVQEILKLTPENQGVDAVFDGVGKDTWESNFQLLKRKGTIVSVGNASGPAPNFSPSKLMEKNLKLCRPTLLNYIHTSEEFLKYCKELFGYVSQGMLKVHTHKPDGYQFSQEGVQQAHTDIASRKTTGKLIVKVS